MKLYYKVAKHWPYKTIAMKSCAIKYNSNTNRSNPSVRKEANYYTV